MQKWLKPISMIVLTSVVVYTVGVFLTFVIVEHHHHEYIEQYIKENYESDLHVKFTLNELKNASWEDEKEFELNGKMYDVVKVENNNGTIVVVCFDDSKEKELENKFDDIRSKTKEINKNVKVNLYPPVLTHTEIKSWWSNVFEFTLVDSTYVDYFISIIKLPPKLKF